MKYAVFAAAALMLVGSAAATLGDNGMTTYTGRGREANTLVFGNQLIVDGAFDATVDMAQQMLTGTWQPTKNDPAVAKHDIELSCLNSVAPAPLNWHMWCPGKDAKIVEWIDKSGATHRQITLRPQANMTSTMAIWFISTYVMGVLPPLVEFQGGVYHYYHLWHPLDHVEAAWALGPAVPGLQAGNLYTLIHERYRNPAASTSTRHYETNGWFFVSDPIGNMMRNRFYITMPLMGLPTWNMLIEFNDTPDGMVVDIEIVAGLPAKGWDERDPTNGFAAAAGLNELLVAPLLAKQKGSPDWHGSIDAITRHAVEEFSNLQFFVPVLYEKYNIMGKKGINWMPQLGTWMQNNGMKAADPETISFYKLTLALSKLQVNKAGTPYAQAVEAAANATRTAYKAATDAAAVANVKISQAYTPASNAATALLHSANNATNTTRDITIQGLKRAVTGGNAADYGKAWFARYFSWQWVWTKNNTTPATPAPAAAANTSVTISATASASGSAARRGRSLLSLLWWC